MLGLTLALGARAGARVSELYGRVLLGLASRIGVHPQREIQCINAVKGGDFRTSDVDSTTFRRIDLEGRNVS